VAGNFCRHCGAATPADEASEVAARDALLVAPLGGTTAEIGAAHAGGTPLAGVASPVMDRRSLVNETRWVMVAFLLPAVVSAVIILAEHASGVEDIARFPSIVHNPVANMLLGILEYVTVASVVPLALYLLARTGQGRRELGLTGPSLSGDVLPALGLGAAGFAVEVVMVLVVLAFLVGHKSLFVSPSLQSVPGYYLIWGIAISAITAVAEEVLVNGYLITRLEQLGWTPRAALLLSLTLRTSYHVYYGLGFIFTIPLGYFITRSFQKNHRLTRCVVAHFLYDAILFAIALH
jgi:membrane protease YdiL (CAAX protease family)